MARTGIDVAAAPSPTEKVSGRDVKTAGNPVWQQHVQSVEAGYDAITHEGPTAIDSTAGGIALPTVPSDAEYALVSLETAQIRWCETEAPTTTNGHLLTPPASDAVYLWIPGRGRLLSWKGIRTGGTSGSIQVTYYKARIPDA